MRTLGLLFLLAGIGGYFYFGDQLSKVEPVPPGISVFETFRYPAGKLEMARDGGGFCAAFGIFLLFIPRSR